MSVPLWRCDDCGGPAWWTFIDGVAHYICKSSCDGFLQLDLFSVPASSLEGLAPEDPNEQVDRDGSVRAVERAEEGRPFVLTKQQAMDLHGLPF